MKSQLLFWILVSVSLADIPDTWTVNPQDYQYNYTITAQLTINSDVIKYNYLRKKNNNKTKKNN